ncbi:class I poly(R)-hydroxyalkanoic acid synthase [Aquisalinus flavus]|uniref:Class I poly(R)-hydroxyalkanoic acid synthase n=2 Tax=Aquisalinus flavus TaxID=1526572 RepID=A0A8J2V2H7_9PROT|nr:class I poly(R)-hydroxyalkanoic acid synthase [Aquisalinus flavus]GGD03177.1 class I poly(R)-hydroxyalkanoic acid synthase [Aquisalinus flavus]
MTDRMKKNPGEETETAKKPSKKKKSSSGRPARSAEKPAKASPGRKKAGSSKPKATQSASDRRKDAGASAKPAPEQIAKAAPGGHSANHLFSDYETMATYVAELQEKGQGILSGMVDQHAAKGRNKVQAPSDPLNMQDTMADVFTNVFSDPYNVMRMQFGMWEDTARLAESMVKKATGNDVDPVAEPHAGDRRFAHPAWTENQTLDYLKQSYLIQCKWARELVNKAEGVDEHTRRKASFYMEQFLAAMAPTNFATTNPEVIEEAMKTRGENFLRGFRNFIDDMERGHGELLMKQADMNYFKVGENLAMTPGKVVYQNDLMQLIQYAPTTDDVATRPMLIIPPWINKFYILDLQPDTSLIRWLVAQGRTVFVVSWVNPGSDLAHKSFADYMHEGIFDALEAIEKATGENQVDTIGYCIGGTLLGCTLAYMAAKKDERIQSATFFTAQMDFREAGELLLFIDDQQIANLEKQIDAAGGVMEASAMSKTFNMLRPVDLIWSVYIDNYLKGKEPKQFDLLYWNSDSTGMSKEVYLFYLREFYQSNRLSQGELVLDNVRLDLGRVKIPVFMQAGEKDHIAPPRSIYRSARLYGGPTRFMLAGSGHIAGVVNHPDRRKYHYSTNDALPETMEDWVEGATRHDYSWWPYWMEWLNEVSRGTVPARVPGDGKLKVIEDAPGSYVKVTTV